MRTNGFVLITWRRVFVVIMLTMASSAFATRRIEYRAVVTNIIDGSRVAISGRPSWGGGLLNLPNAVQLDGIEVPELSHSGGVEAQKALENLTLNKMVQFIECLDGGASHGACLFVLDENGQYTEDDCVNLIMVNTGMARWAGRLRTSSISGQKMEEAQRQARLARRGIWAGSSSGPSSSTTSLTAVAVGNVPDASRPGAQTIGSVDIPGHPVAKSGAEFPSRKQAKAGYPLAVGTGLLIAAFIILRRIKSGR